MRKELNVTERTTIVKLRLGYPKSTVADTCKRWIEVGSVESKKRSGRPKKRDDRSLRRFSRRIKQDRRASAGKLTEFYRDITGSSIHPNTARNYMRHLNFYRRIAKKKPFISQKNRLWNIGGQLFGAMNRNSTSKEMMALLEFGERNMKET